MARRHLRPRTAPAAAAGPGGELTTARRAVARAIGVAGADALRVVLIGDRRQADRILEGLGTDPPPEAELRIAARPGLLVADATGARDRGVRRLARALPRRRPLDAIGYLPSLDGDDDRREAEQAHRLANLLRVRAALHVVVPSEDDRPVFEPCHDPGAPDARALTRGLGERLARGWLRGGVRPALGGGDPDSGGRLEVRAKAAIERSRSESLVLSSLAWGGRGLAAAAESTWDRTVPRERCGRGGLTGAAALAAGIALGALGGFTQAKQVAELEHALSVLAPVLPGARADPGALAGRAKARRYGRAAAVLARASGPSVSSPLSVLLPGGAALRKLASRTVTDAVVRPAQEAVRERIARALRPGADPDEWLDRASAELAQSAEPEPYGAAAVLAAAYDSPEEGWRRLLARAARRFPATAAAPFTGEAKASFVRTMGAFARDRYAKGTLLGPARRAASAPRWRGRMTALRSVEVALGAGEGRWLSPGGSDPEVERVLARARGVLDEKTVERARSVAGRAGDDARKELESLRLGGAYPLVDLDGDEGPALGPAVRRLLRAYEALAREELLDPAGASARGAAGAGFSARRLLASLKRLDRRIAATGIGQGLGEWPRAEIEQAAFDEAADRIETAAAGPLAAHQGAVVREIEGLARAKGAWRAVARIGAVRAKFEAAASREALRAIEEEDPLAVEFDADTDRHAVLERVVAGIERLDALHRREPGFGDSRWEALGRSLRGYRDADRSSVLTRMAERAREYAERGTTGCGAPGRGTRIAPAGGYPDRAFAAFELRLDALCRAAGARAAVAAKNRLRSFYREQLAWRWPYSDEPGAPAVPRSTLAELLRRAAAREAGDLSPDLRSIVEPWSRNRRGEPVLAITVEWRTAPEREQYAQHVASCRLEGLQALESGRRGWRYGDPLHVRLRLAKDSPLRFAGGAAETSIPIGEGSWVRSLATGAAAATLAIEAPVTGARGEAGTLRISAVLRPVREPRAARTPGRAGPSLATARPIHASRSPLAGLL